MFVYNQINIQEVVVETSGVGADRDTGGLQLNMIARDGGNTFAGIATFAYVGPSLEMSNINAHSRSAAGGVDQEIQGLGGRAGRPDQTRPCVFFAAFREGVTQQFAEGVYYNN